MNKLLIFITVILNSNCTAQNNINVYYKSAYDYLKELPEINKNRLNISDTIVHIDISNFYEELSTGNNKESMLIKLDSMDRNRNIGKYTLPELRNLPSDTTSIYTLFFSEIIDDKLLAEIVENKGLKKTSYERLTTFNKSKVFLFVFDGKKISKVYCKKIQYD